MSEAIGSKAVIPNPAPLHRLACASLNAFLDAIQVNRWQKDIQVNHRIVFTQVFFLVCDAIRHDEAGAFPVQAEFESLDRSEGSWLKLPTITNVLDQCVSAQWMIDPQRNELPNYSLTEAGMAVAQQWHSHATTSIDLSEYVRTLIGNWSKEKRGLGQLRIPLLEAAARAHWSPTLYPYYNTSSNALKPYFDGVKHRVTS